MTITQTKSSKKCDHKPAHLQADTSVWCFFEVKCIGIQSIWRCKILKLLLKEITSSQLQACLTARESRMSSTCDTCQLYIKKADIYDTVKLDNMTTNKMWQLGIMKQNIIAVNENYAKSK